MMNESYNPDVLACLANLSSDEVFTPPALANRVLDLLPGEIWTDPNLKFLDPFTKSGVFLREITIRLSKGLALEIPDTEERINHILRNQVFGIATSELTSLIARRTLYCSKTANGEYSITDTFDNEQGNITYERLDHEWANGKCIRCNANQLNPVFSRSSEFENLAYPFLHLKNESLLANNTFDIIVGAPPYHLQDSDGNPGASPIYPLFVEKAKSLNPKLLAMIIPARWFAGGKGLQDFRSTMLNDKSISKLIDFPITNDIYKGLKVIGGICIFLRDLTHNDDCEVETNMNGISSVAKRNLSEFDTFVRFNDAIPIIRKFIKTGSPSLEGKVSQQKPFGLRTNYKGKDHGELKVYMRNGTSFCNESDIKVNRDLIDKWKVLTTMGYGEGGEIKGYPRYIINKPVISEPGSICTETYIVVNAFDSKEEAENFKVYLETKIIRFLIGMRKNTQHVSSDRFKFVPDLPMGTKWTDEILRKKYEIAENEYKFIESLISPIRN